MGKVRASRDGHEFHEAWVARKALELVMPQDALCGIAVEGLSPADEVSASSATTEIADVVLYYGASPTMADADSVSVIQVKYSKSSASRAVRAADAAKTIEKFAAAYKNLRKTRGVAAKKKVAFELVTNRPIEKGFLLALNSIATGSDVRGDVKRQVSQIRAASGLTRNELADFAARLLLTGLAGNLEQNKFQVSRTLADWSAARDTLARARLGNLKQLVRDKAGLAGEHRNVITRVDVLAALDVSEPADLFPCPNSFPEVGRVVEREQLVSVASLIPALEQSLLIHGDGGGGKTVFLQSLAGVLGKKHHTVLFDCFGGGAYRAPDDARHLPKRALIHIVNDLSVKGLCDPLLPENEHAEELVKAFRGRLAQAVDTLRRWSADTQLILFIDAIDNAAEQASERGELSFPRLLLESFAFNGTVPGVQLVMSCRTYRRSISIGSLPCHQVRLEPFSIQETEKYLRARIATVTETEVQVAFSRSEGNPRVLEHLALGDRGLLEDSEVNQIVRLDDLLKARIEKALEEASRRGYTSESIDSFLAGLAVLPPPVPLDEYAHAHGMDVSAVKSFAADLAPLVEQTKHGLMFRDEPTETFMRAQYAANTNALRRVATNLLAKQDSSVYAASALPTLLQMLGEGQKLFDLAFDERFPATITSTVGKQNIRYARLKAAVRYSAGNSEYDRLAHLLLELTTLAALNERGTTHIIDNPDLVIASGDVDAIRRLFETRTSWPGKRHARLAVASVLSGDLANAFRHAVSAYEWTQHFYAQDDEYRQRNPGPEKLDIAAIPVCMIAQNRWRDAVRELARWKDWYAFELSALVFSLARQAQGLQSISKLSIVRFLNSVKTQLGLLAGALSFADLSSRRRRRLVTALASACEHKRIEEKRDPFHRDTGRILEDGLLKSSAIALSLRMREESTKILSALSIDRPRLWSLSDRASNEAVFPFIACTALQFATRGTSVTSESLLPAELVEILKKNGSSDPAAFHATVTTKLDEYFESQRSLPKDQRTLSYETKQDAQRFLSHRLNALVEITANASSVFAAPINEGDSAFLELVSLWEQFRRKQEHFVHRDGTNHFFDSLGRRLVVFALWARNDLSSATVNLLINKVVTHAMAPVQPLIEMTEILAGRTGFHEAAGILARKAAQLIELEDDVGHRAALFAQLSRAILAASSTEAAAYFHTSIEQMDAIGSGDYGLTNELLQFAAGLHGPELNDAQFHTLANICELNMPGDSEKFPWAVFGAAMTTTSGCRGLARISRWADRDKVSLDYTLLPYLDALLERNKMNPQVALALLRLSSPAELYLAGTEQLAETIVTKYEDKEALLSDLISQFDENNVGLWMASTLGTLQQFAERTLGESSEQNVYLSALVPRLTELREKNNRNQDSHSPTSGEWKRRDKREQRVKRESLIRIARATDPADQAAMAKAIDAINALKPLFEAGNEFFATLRAKVSFADRPTYIRTVANLEHLDLYLKLAELKAVKDAWSSSSAAIDSVFREIARPIIELHAADFIYYEHFSTTQLKTIADLSGRPIPELVLEFLRVFTAPKTDIPASVWLAFATLMLEKTSEGEGQAALTRLLTSNAAKLAASVADGAWQEGLYPKNGERDIASGLVWKMLGSPSAADRWRAAHSIRSLARFGQWEVIDGIVDRIHAYDAGPYQAAELTFFFQYAKLWLLIAIARVAIDHPERIAGYAGVLKRVALDDNIPHVLFRLFATRALLECFKRGSLALSEAEERQFANVNESPFPLKKTEDHRKDSLYSSRPPSIPAPEAEFHLDYDFDKIEVSEISDIFDRLRWETRDAITGWVRKYDTHVSSMYETDGRQRPHRDALGVSAWHQTYGQQLGVHGLYLTAGEFLAKYPVAERPYGYADPWHRWLSDEELTRNDGLWLADGIDRTPIDSHANLFERKKGKLSLTGDRTKILALLGIGSQSFVDLVVSGHWDSDDGVGISISSALISAATATKAAEKSCKQDPFQAWLPHAEEYENAYGPPFRETPFRPWIYWPSAEGKLDDTDPLGSRAAAKRRSLVKQINEIGSLAASDPFTRRWVDRNGNAMVRSEVWSRNRSRNEFSPTSERLICNARFLREVLASEQSELLLLVGLQRYERGYGTESGKYWHTTAVVRVDQSLKWKYHPGAVNKLHKMKY